MTTQHILSWLLIAGVLSGFVFQRSRLCFVSALRDLFLFRALRMTRAMLLLFLLTVTGGATLQAVRGVLVEGFPGPTPAGALAGGAIFAVGMVLAGSCIAGAFWRLGEGQLSQLAVLAGVLAGTWLYVNLPFLTTVTVQETFNAWIAVGLLLLGLMAVAAWERRQPRVGEELPGARRLSWVRAPWAPELGAVVMAVLLVTFMALTGTGWGVSRAFLLTDFSAAAYAGGLLIGGFLGARLGREFRVRGPGGRAPTVIRLLGGVLMGYGARVGWGCTIGAVMTGMVNLSFHPWYWMLGAMLGAWVGAELLRRFMYQYL